MKFSWLMVLLLAISQFGCVGRSDSLVPGQEKFFITYAEEYAPARTALQQGKIAEYMTQTEALFVSKDGKKLSRDEIIEDLLKNSSELSIIERGLLTLNGGDFERALMYFDAAEQKLEYTEAESGFSKHAGKVVKTFWKWGTGYEEATDYEIRGYEKVMLLNYKALCYMLLGDRKAYNVTRRAIDMQQAEWETHKEKIAEFEAKFAKASDEEKEIIRNIEAEVQTEEIKKKANMVHNPYVNPFGDYVNALLMEMDGIDDKTIRDNSIIAYKKVLQNNKDCTTAKSAVKEVRRGIPRGYKLVHILLADGFSPEWKEKTVGMQIKDVKSVVNIATAMPVLSNVDGARVYYAGKVQTFSSLSKMESIILRYDKDTMFFKREIMEVFAKLRSGALNIFGGNLGLGLAVKMQRPETRSWRTLPNKVMAARFYVPNRTQKITIETFDKKRRTMAKISVNLAEKGPTVVYAVSYDKQLNAFANKHSWIVNK